jgi:hypothetical protein
MYASHVLMELEFFKKECVRPTVSYTKVKKGIEDENIVRILLDFS